MASLFKNIISKSITGKSTTVKNATKKNLFTTKRKEAAYGTWQERKAISFLLLVFLSILGIKSNIYADGDTFWEARNGIDILRGKGFNQTNTYTWIDYDRSWHPNSWLFNIIDGFLYQTFGTFGIRILQILIVLSCFILLYAAGKALKINTAYLFLATLLIAFFLIPNITIRAISVTNFLVIFATSLAALSMKKDSKGFYKKAALLFFFQIFSINFHLAALLSVFTISLATFTAAALTKDKAKSFIKASILTSLTLTASLVSPAGISIFKSSFHTSSVSRSEVGEWGFLLQDSPATILYWLLAIGALVFSVKIFIKEKNHLFLSLSSASLGLILISAFAERFLTTALILQALLLAKAAEEYRTTGKEKTIKKIKFIIPRLNFILGMIGVTLIILGTNTNNTDNVSLKMNKAIPKGCRVLNEVEQGGWIELYHRNDGTLASTDGRTDFFSYQDYKNTYVYLNNPAYEKKLDENNINCVISVVKNKTPARNTAPYLEKSGKWHLVVKDNLSVLLLRNSVYPVAPKTKLTK